MSDMPKWRNWDRKETKRQGSPDGKAPTGTWRTGYWMSGYWECAGIRYVCQNLNPGHTHYYVRGSGDTVVECGNHQSGILANFVRQT